MYQMCEIHYDAALYAAASGGYLHIALYVHHYMVYVCMDRRCGWWTDQVSLRKFILWLHHGAKLLWNLLEMRNWMLSSSFCYITKLFTGMLSERVFKRDTAVFTFDSKNMIVLCESEPDVFAKYIAGRSTLQLFGVRHL
jgi:hypothetical protein